MRREVDLTSNREFSSQRIESLSDLRLLVDRFVVPKSIEDKNTLHPYTFDEFWEDHCYRCGKRLNIFSARHLCKDCNSSVRKDYSDILFEETLFNVPKETFTNADLTETL